MKNLFSLQGKSAVVIGGGGGIGRAIAKGLAFYGAEVLIAGRAVESLTVAAEEIYRETGRSVHIHPVNVEDENSVNTLVTDAEQTLGGVDILVNSQGVNIKKSAFDMTVADWDKTFAVNTRGVMLCSLGFAKKMCERGFGRIIIVSSVREYGAAPGNGLALSYSSSKGAVRMFSRQLAAELADKGVTVNTICPAATKTAAGQTTEKLLPGIEQRLIAKIPLGRMAAPEDMIGAAVYLASEAGAFVTGTDLFVDGGFSCVN